MGITGVQTGQRVPKTHMRARSHPPPSLSHSHLRWRLLCRFPANRFCTRSRHLPVWAYSSLGTVSCYSSSSSGADCPPISPPSLSAHVVAGTTKGSFLQTISFVFLVLGLARLPARSSPASTASVWPAARRSPSFGLSRTSSLRPSLLPVSTPPSPLLLCSSSAFSPPPSQPPFSVLPSPDVSLRRAVRRVTTS